MKNHFLTLLQHNNAPSETEIAEINGLLLDPLKEKAVVESEIRHLEALLEESRKRLNGIEDTISIYTRMLAPIRRLPDDIFREIFYQCLPTHRYSLMSASEAPLLLTRICSSWRMIALTSPRIWTRLHITIPSPEPDMESDDEVEVLITKSKREAASPPPLSQVRLEAIRDWLSLSGTCPLSISLMFPKFTVLPPGTHTHASSEAIFQTIIPFANRWRDIELTMPETIYEIFNRYLSLDMLSSLHCFRADLRNGTPMFINMPTPHYEPAILLRSPNLTKLSFSRASWSATSWKQEIPAITWNRLTYLSLHTPIRDMEVFGLLEQCHNIIDCKLTIVAIRQTPEDREADRTRLGLLLDRTINLPHLRSFNIEDGGGIAATTQLFKSLNTPSLMHIEYVLASTRVYYPQDLNEPSPSPQPFSLLPLIAQAPITKLTLDSHRLLTSDIETCIRVAPSLKYFAIGKESKSDPRPTPLFVYPDIWDIMILSSDRSSDDGLPTPLLLPDLESLFAYDLRDLTDANLLRFIASRIDAWKCGRATAPLKLVKVYFQRGKQLDIVDEAVSYAKAAGVDLRLDLQYTTPKSKYLDSESIFFGLTSDDLTWRDPDIEESSPSLF